MKLKLTELGLSTFVSGYEHLNPGELQVLLQHFKIALTAYDDEGLGTTLFDQTKMSFMRGHTPRVVEYLCQQGFEIEWMDNNPARLENEFDDKPFAGEYRGLQQWAVTEMRKHYYGILQLATRFGKSYVYGGWYVESGRPRTLILVPREAIAKQMQSELGEFLGEPVGIIAKSTGIKDDWRQLTIAIDKSMFDKDGKLRRGREKYLNWIEAVIRDECHNFGTLGNDLYLHLPRMIYSWGGSATPFTGDNVKDFRIEGLTGPVRAKAGAKLLSEYGLVAALKCYWVKHYHDPLMDDTWHVIYHNAIVNNHKRNQTIVDICKQHALDQMQGVVFVDRVEHGEILASLIPDSKFVSSQVVTPKQADKIKEQFNNREFPTVITTKKWREGVTFYADYAVNAEGMRADHVTIQKAGRPIMPRTDGRMVLWYDFWDQGLKQLEAQSEQRMQCMRSEGWEQEVVND